MLNMVGISERMLCKLVYSVPEKFLNRHGSRASFPCCFFVSMELVGEASTHGIGGLRDVTCFHTSGVWIRHPKDMDVLWVILNPMLCFIASHLGSFHTGHTFVAAILDLATVGLRLCLSPRFLLALHLWNLWLYKLGDLGKCATNAIMSDRRKQHASFLLQPRWPRIDFPLSCYRPGRVFVAGLCVLRSDVGVVTRIWFLRGWPPSLGFGFCESSDHS